MKVIIVGAGKLGYKLAESFSDENNNVIVIDLKKGPLENIEENLEALTIQGNGLETSILEQANSKKADLFVAVTSSDEINILASSVAKSLGSKKVVARIRNHDYDNQLELFKKEFNIDYIANPEYEMAKVVARYLRRGYANNIRIENFADGKVGMVDFNVRNLKGIVGKKISELDLPSSILVAAILRDNETIIPHGDDMIESDDVIYVIGQRDSINKFFKLYGAPIYKRSVRKVMILGGGRAAYHLANRLLQNHVTVKIIEHNKDRCEYLAEQLKGALIIYGDGTDRNLLAEENINKMDALVSMTGIDEENLLLSLLGKKMGISKVIAKVSRPNYVPIIEQLGIDLAVNPALIMASDILRFIQGGTVVSLSLLMQGQAEVLEIIAKENSYIVNKPLHELKLPKGIIIGAIVHKGDVIIPDGSTVINPKDRVIIFCLYSDLARLEKMLHSGKRSFFNELWNNRKGSR